MWHSVRDNFVSFKIVTEGRKNYMYCDKDGNVTTGIGTLLMDVNAARKLQWYINGTRTAASPKEIEESFNKVKIRYKDLKEKGEKLTNASLYKSTTNIRLTQKGINQATIKKLNGFDFLWKASLPQWDSFPADAQLALFSISWAMGTPANIRLKMKALYEAVTSRDFTKAAEESHFKGTSSKREWKNQAYEFMFLNAAAQDKFDKEILKIDILASKLPIVHIVFMGLLAQTSSNKFMVQWPKKISFDGEKLQVISVMPTNPSKEESDEF